MDTNEDLAEIERAMLAAAEQGDFETAAALRNQLMVLRAGGATGGGNGDFAGLKRQQPGAMGIGTQHPKPARPSGWKPPKKPSPMTSNRGRRR